MYEYQPIIKEDNFNDAKEISETPTGATLGVARSKRDRTATNQIEIKFCSVEKLWLETPGKKGPEDKAVMFPHGDIAADAPNRWHFAPKEETIKICWELKGRFTGDGNYLANPITLKLELFTRNNPTAIWTKSIKWKAGECPKRGETEFNGLLKEDILKTAKAKTEPTTEITIKSDPSDKFPDQVLTVDQSPYKLKLSIVDGGEPRLRVAKWIFIDILVDSLEVKWGDYALLPQTRPDIDPKNLEKILGHKKNPSDVKDKDVKGFEETILEELKTDNAQPTEGKLNKVILTSNLFAFQEKEQEHKESFEKNTDFESYKELWGNGARIPLLIKAFIKTSKDEKTDKVPEALGNAKILWDWEEKKADRWKEPLNGGKAPKTEPFLDGAYKKNSAVKPVALSNCPKEFGGKLGSESPDANVFPEQASGGDFPFEVKNCAVRKWSSLSSFGKDDRRDTSGVIFQPSRMAGDAYTIKAFVHFDRDKDSEDEIQAPAPIQTKSFDFKVFRRITLHSLVRGRAKLNTDPATLETQLKTDYLKELDMVVDIKPSDVDNDVYKDALVKAIDRVCSQEHFVKEVEKIPYLPLFARSAVNLNPNPDSPGVVFRDWDVIKTKLEQKFKNSSMAVVTTLPGNFLDEEIKGKTSNADGTLVTVDGKRFLLYTTGAGFQNGEQVEGKSSKETGQLIHNADSKSCWGHKFELIPKTEKDNKIYKDSIKVVFPGDDEVIVKYKKQNIKKGFELSPLLTLKDKDDISAAFTKALNAHNEADSFEIKIYGRNDSDNAKQRCSNVSSYLDELFAREGASDRKEGFEAVLKSIKKAFTTPASQKMLALLLVGEITWEYAAQKFPGEEGIFLLHIPGRYKGYTFTDENSTDPVETKMPKVQGAVYPELTGETNSKPFSARNRAISFLATVSDGAADPIRTKTVASIFKHELAHALFLPHSPFRTDAGKITPEPKAQCHVKEDSCLMNYDLDTEHFCGMCMIRIRGWNWKSDSFKNQVSAVQILNGDENTYLTAAGVQYVNLPAESKFVEAAFTKNINRLGRKLKVKVEFAQEKAGQNCYIQLLAHKDNAVYSGTEKGRKPAFNFTQNPAAVPLGDFNLDHGALVSGTTDKNGNFTAEFDLSPAVGDRYKVAAWDDDDNRVESVEITTRRAIYYMILRYTNPHSVASGQIQTTINNAFSHNFTDMIFAGEEIDPNNQLFDAETDHPKTVNAIRSASSGDCSNLPGKKYSDLDPFLSRITLMDMCVKPRAIDTTKVTGMVGNGQPDVRVQVRNQPDQPGWDLRKGLWHGLGDNPYVSSDKPLNPPVGNTWFVGGTITLHRQSVTATVRITKDSKNRSAVKSGNALVTVTATGMPHSPKAIKVALSSGDMPHAIARKISVALTADADVNGFFMVESNAEFVILTKRTSGVHDAAMNIAIANGSCKGLTAAPTATNTAAGTPNPLIPTKGLQFPVDFGNLTPVEGDLPNRPGCYNEIDVKVDNLMETGAVISAQNAEIALQVYVLNQFVNGMARLKAAQQNGIIVIPARRDFKLIPTGGQLNSIIHELGHCMGMNANPTETSLDSHAYHYNHNGDHCRFGLAQTPTNDGPSYQIQANQDLLGLCVMFGFVSNVNPRTAFCPECEKVMKKIDASAGLL